MKTMKVAAVAAVCLAAGASVAALAQASKPRTAQIVPGGAINQNLGDADYGVCRGINPSCYHDWPRPKTGEYHVLIFTHTAGPRHADLGTAFPDKAGLNPPLADNNVVQRELPKLLAKEGIKADYTEDLSVFTGSLSGYNAVIFYSTSRDNLDDGAKTALRQYMRKGGGFVAIHNAFGTLYNWPYYEGLLGGANYFDHGAERTGNVVVLDKKDASTKGLPSTWKFKDEWYNLIPFPTHVRYLATLDEKSWDPNEARGGGGAPPGAARGAAPAGAPAAADGAAPPAGRAGRGGAAPGGAPGGGRAPSVVGEMPGHGSFHPVAWCQYYDGGKAFMTTLGHDAHDFDADDSQFPGAVEFQKLIVGGIKSVIGMEPFCK